MPPTRELTKPELPVKGFTSPKTLTTWLEKNHAKSNGIWLKLGKKDAGVKSVTYAEAVEAALCYGWIDGQAQKFDERYYLIRYTPRRARSIWSKINRAKATALIDTGAMQAPGMREVERARADGRWDAAYDSPRNTTMPDDLAAALAKNSRATKFFATLDGRNRYAVMHRVATAKQPEQRARRITQFVEMLAHGEKLHER